MLTLKSAYGRSYTSKDDVANDFYNDKDFVVASIGPEMGRYANHKDLVNHTDDKQVKIRYNDDYDFVILDIKRDEDADGEGS